MPRAGPAGPFPTIIVINQPGVPAPIKSFTSMKAEELMIGDWVYGLYPDGSRYTRPFRISAVDIYPLNRSPRIVTFGGYGFQEEHLEPIPLTPEILEKNGFGYTEGDEELTHFYLGEPQFCKDMDLHIGTNNRGVFWLNTYNNDIRGLRYIHELQHALRLCGIEKEITI